MGSYAKMDLGEVAYGRVGWLHDAQDTFKPPFLMGTVINIRFP
jgi:hypothetical protein